MVLGLLLGDFSEFCFILYANHKGFRSWIVLFAFSTWSHGIITFLAVAGNGHNGHGIWKNSPWPGQCASPFFLSGGPELQFPEAQNLNYFLGLGRNPFFCLDKKKYFICRVWMTGPAAAQWSEPPHPPSTTYSAEGVESPACRAGGPRTDGK